VAVAGCHANSLLAEAAGRGIWLRGLDVDIEIEWVDHPPRTRSVTVHVRVVADADEPAVMELVEHADRVGRVANSIRMPVPVHVADLHVTAVPSGDRR
jgi:organic hydroperoxide reductase OsmC/OhrA